MTCSKTQLLIDEIGDLDRLPPVAARHLAGCQACERFGSELLQLRALLREPGRIAAPADFDSNLTRRLRAARASSPRPGVWSWMAVPRHGLATAAALGLVAFGSITVWRSIESASPVTSPSVSAPRQVVPPTSDAVGIPPQVSAPVAPREIASATGPKTISRPTNRRQSVVRGETASSDAMILVRDEAGTRVVSVPTVVVGAERVVPASLAVAAPSTSDASVSF